MLPGTGGDAGLVAERVRRLPIPGGARWHRIATAVAVIVLAAAVAIVVTLALRRDPKPIAVLPTLNAEGTPVFSPNGKLIATSDVGAVNLWNAVTARFIATLPDPAPDGLDVASIAFSPDGKLLAYSDSAGLHGHTYLWNIATHRLVATLVNLAWWPDLEILDLGQSITEARFSDGKLLVTADGDGSTYLWDIAPSGRYANLNNQPGLAQDPVALSPDGKTLAVLSGESPHPWDFMSLEDAATSSRFVTFTDPRSLGVASVAFSRDGKLLAAADRNGGTYLWDVATRRRIATFTDPSNLGVASVAFDPSGKLLATVDVNSGSVYLWDVATRNRIAAFTGPSREHLDWAGFSPGGKLLATLDDEGHVELWDITGYSAD